MLALRVRTVAGLANFERYPSVVLDAACCDCLTAGWGPCGSLIGPVIAVEANTEVSIPLAAASDNALSVYLIVTIRRGGLCGTGTEHCRSRQNEWRRQ